jgi:hypothetical protein
VGGFTSKTPGSQPVDNVPSERGARSAHAFTQSRKSSLGLQPVVGNTKLQVFSAFAFHAFGLLVSFAGIGISRSLYAFGVQFRSGLWLPEQLKLRSLHRTNMCT